MTGIASVAQARPIAGGVWASIAVVMVALNLRPAIVAAAPMVDTISSELALSSFLAGALVSLPVLCFSILGPISPLLAARIGFERSLALALIAIIAGSAVRLVPTIPGLFLGTLLIGAGIGVGNILLPGLIKRDFSHRLGLMSGLYSMSLTAGATLAAGITIPVAAAAGWGWSEAVASWGLFALFGLMFWLPQLWHARKSVGHPRGKGVRLLDDHVAWYVTAFFGLQSFNFYSTTAWLPAILIASGHDAVFAGIMLSVVHIAGVIPALLVPMAMTRMRSQSALIVLVTLIYVVGLVGFLLIPGGGIISMVLLGVGRGAALAIALTLIVLRSPDAAHATKLSGMSQSWGYLFAAIGPLALGLLHDLSSAWSLPLVLLLVVLVFQMVSGYLAGRPRFVGRQSGEAGGNRARGTEQV